VFISIYINYADLGSSNELPKFNIQTFNDYYELGSIQSGFFLKLKKRDNYPSTYCYQIDESNIVFGYGKLNPHEGDEFLQAAISKKGSLLIQRDIFATMPLFFIKTVDLFLASNNYGFVANHLNHSSINQVNLLETLIPNPDRHQTLISGIQILDERHILEINNQQLRTIKPNPRTWGTSKQAGATNPRIFSSQLCEVLDKFIESRLSKEEFAFEVSGGIDSATLPLYFAKKRYKDQCLLGSMIFPGSFEATQIEKLRQLSSQISSELIAIRISEETDYPLARFIKTGHKRQTPFYSFEEIYSEALLKLAKSFQAKNIKVLATGIGGDELFENIVSTQHELQFGAKEKQRRRKMSYPPFLTEKYIEEYVSSTPSLEPYPLSLLAVSVYGAQLARNNIYIEHDIWPVSPFTDTELYNYCQGLPAHFRANKNILRAFHQANDFPESIYNPQQNEHFGMFFEQAIKSEKYARAINYFVKHSALSQMGYVDTNKLLEFYNNYRFNRAGVSKWLLNVFAWLSLEINIKASKALLSGG